MSTTSSDYVIETHALSKRYGRKLALDHLDLQVPRGRIHAIVGANGAGKSTLFRILLGFLAPTSGSSRILGRDSQQLTPQDRARIGFVNEEHTLPGWIRVDQVSAMQHHQYPHWNQRAYDEVIGHYHVLPEQKIGQLSRGERAGFNLALALAQSPELLVLDEPTLGLDANPRSWRRPLRFSPRSGSGPTSRRTSSRGTRLANTARSSRPGVFPDPRR